jgi:predicted ATPase/DNA-binding winged helix-turn-helix (wHTH) protein
MHESGRVEVDLDRRQLFVRGAFATIGERAFQIFALLIRSPGELLSKEEIMHGVWPGAIVSDNALEAHVSALRKALGAERGLLKTAYGRGYRVVGAWTASEAAPPIALDTVIRVTRPVVSNLPLPTSSLIGRDDASSAVMALLAEHRLVTLVGTGGIGKTRLAIDIAHRLLEGQPDGVALVELASLSNPAMVPGAAATALGIDIANSDGLQTIGRVLTAKRLLLVLDNCEHLVEAVAQLAETVLRRAAGVRVLATSREPLRADGEHLFSVPPLSVPAEGTPVEQLTEHSAVQLFLARAAAGAPGFPTNPKCIVQVGLVCRCLDGIPLALELAASRAATLGMEALVARLDDRFRLLTGGRRTALPRHQTLRATLDWSFGLLSDNERAVLRRLAVFAGAFDIDAATCVAASDDVPADLVVDCVAELVAKSLIVSQAEGAAFCYRLLDTTRAYALEKLGFGPERQTAARLHAAYHRDLFEQADAEWGWRPLSEWLAAYAPRIDDLRAALDWAFSPAGDMTLGAELASLSAPLWFQLSLLSAGWARFERALAAIDPDRDNPRARLHLNAALGWLGMFDPARLEQRETAWTATLELAQVLDEPTLELRALWALYVNRIGNGDFHGMARMAQRFHAAGVRSGDPFDVARGERVIGFTLHIQGRHAEARQRLENLMDRPEYRLGASRVVGYQYDHRVIVRMTLGNVYWLLGFPDKALHNGESTVAETISTDHIPSLCSFLCDSGLPVAYLCGDFAAVERYVGILRSRTADDGKMAWWGYADCYEGAVAARRGAIGEGLGKVRTVVERRRAPSMRWHLVFLLGLLADGCAVAGLTEDGSAAIDEALARAEESGADWCMPELLRIKGDILAVRDPMDRSARQCLQRAITLAQSQGALAWELRAATSLARLEQKLGRPDVARQVLAPVYDRFSEGFGTLDLRQASHLLEALR